MKSRFGVMESRPRSFTFIDDCLYGIQAIMESDICDPINLGSAEMVSINQLVDIVEEIAGVHLKRRYNLDAPKGVRGRSSDNTLNRQLLGWEPSIPLREGHGEDLFLDLRSDEEWPLQGCGCQPLLTTNTSE